MIRKEEGFAGQRSAILPADTITQLSLHPLCESLYITDIGYYPTASFHDRDRSNGCAEHILIYCSEGRGWFKTNDSRFGVTADSFFIIPANHAHSYGADPENPWSIYWIHFTGRLSHDFIDFLDLPTGPIPVAPRQQRLVLFDDILAHLEMSFNEENLVYASNALRHFLTTFKRSLVNPIPASISGQDAIGQTIDYMKQNLDKSLTLSELAGVANMSASHYSAVFRQKIQKSPIHFFTFLKIQRACQLLKDTSMRIGEVADQVGYQDAFHFSRIFAGMMGISPRDFRRGEKS